MDVQPGALEAWVRTSELTGSRLLVKTRPDVTGVMGAPCWVAFDIERWHLFEKASGVAYF